jgi:hypothetical protein
VDRSRREKIPRLTLNLVDNDFFKSLITNQTPMPPITKPSHKLILRASALARERSRKSRPGTTRKITAMCSTSGWIFSRAAQRSCS